MVQSQSLAGEVQRASEIMFNIQVFAGDSPQYSSFSWMEPPIFASENHLFPDFLSGETTHFSVIFAGEHQLFHHFLAGDFSSWPDLTQDESQLAELQKVTDLRLVPSSAWLGVGLHKWPPWDWC